MKQTVFCQCVLIQTLLVQTCIAGPFYDKLEDYFFSESDRTEEFLNSYISKIPGSNATPGEEISKFTNSLNKKAPLYFLPTPKKFGSRYFLDSSEGLHMYDTESEDTEPVEILKGCSLGREISPDGQLVSFCDSDGNSLQNDTVRLGVKNITSGKFLPDSLNTGCCGRTTWTRNQGFFYVMSSEEACETVSTDEDDANVVHGINTNTTKLISTGITNYKLKLHYHVIGWNQSRDDFITDISCGEPYPRPSIELSTDERYIFINIPGYHLEEQEQVYAKLTRNGDSFLPIHKLIPINSLDKDVKFRYVGSDSNKPGFVYMLKSKSTSDGDPETSSQKLVKLDLERITKDRSNPIEHSVSQATQANWELRHARVFGRKLFLHYVQTASNPPNPNVILKDQLQILDLDTGSTLFQHIEETVEFSPEFFNDDEIIFRQFRRGLPDKCFYLSVKSQYPKLVQITGNWFPTSALAKAYDDYVTKLHHFTSKDGTEIPIFITAKKGFKPEGNSPTLIYLDAFTTRYSYISPFMPAFDGILVLTLIRSTVYGKSIEDLISSVEYLIEKNYTNPSKILLVGDPYNIAAINAYLQRPELFKAVITSNFQLDLVGYRNYLCMELDVYSLPLNDYCLNATLVDELRKFSPLEVVQSAIENYPLKGFPAVMIHSRYLTKDTDYRYIPEGTFRYKRAFGSQGGNIYLRNFNPNKTGEDNQARDTLAFAGKVLGLNITVFG